MVVDIYGDEKRRGICPPLFTFTLHLRERVVSVFTKSDG